jgi:hypothetical protein
VLASLETRSFMTARCSAVDPAVRRDRVVMEMDMRITRALRSRPVIVAATFMKFAVCGLLLGSKLSQAQFPAGPRGHHFPRGHEVAASGIVCGLVRLVHRMQRPEPDRDASLFVPHDLEPGSHLREACIDRLKGQRPLGLSRSAIVP